MNLFAGQTRQPGLLNLFTRNAMDLAGSPTQAQPPSLVRRASSQSTTCTNDATGNTCEKPTSSDSTALPIALGVGIPLLLALILLIFFHRKYKKKLRAEDAADEEKYKSMDFGMDLSFGPKNKKALTRKPVNGLDMTAAKHMRGLSLEDTTSPYFLPAGRNSVESLASLGRSLRDHDPYNPGSHLGKHDDMSIRSPSPFERRGTNSTAAPSMFDTKAGLLGHAQADPRSAPPRDNSLPTPPELPSSIQEPEKAMLASAQKSNGGGLAPAAADQSRESYMATEGFRKSNNYLGQFIHSREPSEDPWSESKEFKAMTDSPKVDSATSTLLGSDTSGKSSVLDAFPTPDTTPPSSAASPPLTTRAAPSDQPEHHVNDKFNSVQGSIHDANIPQIHTQSYLSDNSDYGNYGNTEFKVTPASPPRSGHNSMDSEFRHSDYRTSSYSRDSGSNYGGNAPPRGQSLNPTLPEIHEHREPYESGVSDGLRELDFNTNRLSVFMRPLPPDEPNENPEERANRIRSFYKEYFDDSKAPQGQPPAQSHHDHQPQQQPAAASYYEDYDGEYLSNGYSIYDEQHKGFIVGGAPFAAPITRRAMTPPPRAPPRNFRSRANSNAQGSYYGGPPRSRAGSSAGGYMTPRAGSSMSNYQSERGRQPKRQLPPPDPLVSLKTPALLKEDSALYSAFDLAPPPSYRQRQNGMRPDSPLGTERPYSPMVRPHTPLQTSYEELSPMPSPHLLRKSGTFTALDFAPAPRFRGVDTGSDAGSIRSGGSGMSAAQVYALRAGAHRLSRLPKELAGTRDDLMTSLKPKWDMNR